MQKLLIVVAVIALVVMPVLFHEAPREIARWYVAAAKEANLDDDSVAAVAHMDRAIAWNDSNAGLYLFRADCKLEAGQWESGLEDCDRALQLAPDDVGIRFTRSQILARLNRHESAIAELKEVLREQADETPGKRALSLNALAYARAVGKRELADGLANVNKSLEIAGTRAGILDPFGYLCASRGCSAMKRGDNEVALASLNDAARTAEAVYQRTLHRFEILKSLPSGGEEYAERTMVMRSHLAGILKLRATLFDELEQPKKAEHDRERIKELAPSGNLAMAAPIDLLVAFERLQVTSNMLDTRGFLHYQLGELPAARRDMQRAITIIDLLCKHFAWQVEALKYEIVDLRRVTAVKRSMLEGKAVMYYHQMLVHQALGREQAAVRDREVVVELGYEPNDQLY